MRGVACTENGDIRVFSFWNWKWLVEIVSLLELEISEFSRKNNINLKYSSTSIGKLWPRINRMYLVSCTKNSIWIYSFIRTGSEAYISDYDL